MLYESGSTSYLDMLLSADGLSDFISRYYLIGEIAKYDDDLLDTIQREKKQVEKIKTEQPKEDDLKKEIINDETKKEEDLKKEVIQNKEEKIN